MKITDVYVDEFGNDVIVYSDGTTETVYEDGSSYIMGTDGDDKLHGTSADDTINGLAGDDKITGGGGNDTLIGGADSDQILGGGGDDIGVWNFTNNSLNEEGSLDYYNGGGKNGTQGNDVLNLELTTAQFDSLTLPPSDPNDPDDPVENYIILSDFFNDAVAASGNNNLVDFRDITAFDGASINLIASNFEAIDLEIINTGPTAVDDNAETDEDTSVAILVLEDNSNGPDLDPDLIWPEEIFPEELNVIAVDTTGTTGTVTQSGNELTYDPDGKFESLALGQMAFDSFDYTIDDLAGETSSATVTVKINGVNDAPDDPDPADLTQHDDTLLDDTLNPPQPVGYEDDDGELTFRSIVTDIDNGDTVRLEIEVKPIGVAFNESNTLLSAFVSSGSLAEITSTFDDDSYHWRARAEDQHGALSDWVAFGIDDPNVVDFTVSTVPPVPKTAELLAADRSVDDLFATSVSMDSDGDMVIAGARNGDGNAVDSGAAYVYQFDGSAWDTGTKLIAFDGAAGDQFGESVSMDAAGDAVIAGASGDGGFTGSAYIYQFDGSAWDTGTKLTASDGAAFDQFGDSVSMDAAGDTVIAGAIEGDGNVADTGAAYIYQFDGSAWDTGTKLIASDGAAFDFFGDSVSMDAAGDTVIVGASIDDDIGSAYIFQFDGSAWDTGTKLTPLDGALFDSFGSSVSIDGEGDTVIVGALTETNANGIGAGSAYIFQLNAGVWTQQEKLIASDGAASDSFGFSVDIDDDGNTVIVGALSDDDNGSESGSAYIYQFDGTDWNETKKVTAEPPFDGAANDSFGNAVSLDDTGDIGVIGANAHDHAGTSNTGSAYVIDDLLM